MHDIVCCAGEKTVQLQLLALVWQSSTLKFVIRKILLVPRYTCTRYAFRDAKNNTFILCQCVGSIIVREIVQNKRQAAA